MSTLNKEFPKNPQRGDCIITTRRALCGCVYDIRCQWTGSMWLYLSDQWCKPHGLHGTEIVGVKPDDGAPRKPAPEHPLLKVLDYQKHTGGHIPASTINTICSAVLITK